MKNIFSFPAGCLSLNGLLSKLSLVDGGGGNYILILNIAHQRGSVGSGGSTGSRVMNAGGGGAVGAFTIHMASKAGWVSSQYNAGVNRY
jgi:hypothetical protein